MNWSALASGAKEFAALAMPTFISFFFLYTISGITEEVKESQAQTLKLVKQIAEEQRQRLQKVGTIEQDISEVKLRLVGIEMQIEQIQLHHETHRKTNP